MYHQYVFSHANIYKGTWQHPRSKRWHLIDYIIVKHLHKNDIIDSRVRGSADCWTDHKLVCIRLKFHISVQKRKVNAPKRLNVNNLKDPSKAEQLRESISKNLASNDASDEPLEQLWENLRNTVYSSAADNIGYQKRNHRDWFDENTQRSWICCTRN